MNWRGRARGQRFRLGCARVDAELFGLVHPGLAERRSSHTPQRHNRLDPTLDVGVQQVILGCLIDFFLDPRKRRLQRVTETAARKKFFNESHGQWLPTC